MQDRDYQLKDVLDVYRRDGSVIREKARVLLEELLPELYPHIKDPGSSATSKIEIGKFLMDVGDMKPKASAQPPTTAPFSITINIPQPNGEAPITIVGQSVDITDDAVAELGDKPEHIALKMPDFDLGDLVGPPIEG